MSWCVAVAAVTAWSLPASDAQDAAGGSASTGEHSVVLRVTRQHFDNLTRDKFRETVPVERPLLSAWLSGTTVIEGQVHIEMSTDDHEAVFVVVVEGTAETTSVSSVRSVRMYGGGHASFRAEKRVHFDGVSYHGEPAHVSLTNAPYISHIASTRSGLLGRIAVRIAQRRLPKFQPVAAQIVEDDARESLRAEFDRLANDLIEKLNETTPLEETIVKLFPDTKDWVYSLSTTENQIQVSAGPRGLRFPKLPGEEQTDPVELWIRLGKPEISSGVTQIWNTAQILLDQFLSAMTGVPAHPMAERATMRRVGEWVVIAIGPHDAQE